MGYLREGEILDKLIDSLRIAAQASDDIAIRPKKGRTYRELRDALLEAESACRQMGHWRAQDNWLRLGTYMAGAVQKAGDWLRGVPYYVDLPEGGVVKRHRPITLGEKHPLFVSLSAALREAKRQAEKLRDSATGVIGPALRPLPREERRPGAPVRVILPPGMIKTQSGLIVPQGMAAQ
jgi:hypothetical protein